MRIIVQKVNYNTSKFYAGNGDMLYHEFESITIKAEIITNGLGSITVEVNPTQDAEVRRDGLLDPEATVRNVLTQMIKEEEDTDA